MLTHEYKYINILTSYTLIYVKFNVDIDYIYTYLLNIKDFEYKRHYLVSDKHNLLPDGTTWERQRVK